MNLKYLENVTTLAYNSEKCTGCGRCAEVCPHGVFDISDNKARIVDKDLCMECGACVMNCPAAAIIQSWFTGKEPACGCGGDDGNNSGKCC